MCIILLKWHYFDGLSWEIGSVIPGVGADVVVVERVSARVLHSGHVILVEFVEHFFRQRQRFPLVLPTTSNQLRNEEERRKIRQNKSCHPSPSFVSRCSL